ncbi:MAG: acyclic terpene utilization AtuA family protein [Planctomycetes bacterium]|nr:acyclic terpene utilization AtuA family protein [Planctomycetota bacterium]
MRSIRVGNAQAFWGDRPSAARELLTQEPELDFLTMDYLAEVSMSILAKQRQRDSERGYPRDFVDVVRDLASYWAAGGRCRLIANAGGLNPRSCATMCQRALEEAGCRALKIAIVYGDNVLELLTVNDGTSGPFSNLDDGRPLSDVQDRLVTANAYMGCEGIVKALEAGADIVITGRVADPSMVVGACAHAFGWKLDDWYALAGATVAGHLLECGTHVTGGIATDWLMFPNHQHIGFPIAEISQDGSCVVTKGRGSGGAVNEQTVKEQLVYEIGDPARYISPDVCVSFLGLKLETVGKDRVRVFGAIGSPCPSTLKVSATYRDGYRAAGMLTVFGLDAAAKARKGGQVVLGRLAEMGWHYRDAIVEVLGHGDSVPRADATSSLPIIEAVLRIAVESESSEPIEAFTREMIPLVTAGAQGTTGYADGRPSVQEIFRYWPCLIETRAIEQQVEIWETRDTLANNPESETSKRTIKISAGPSKQAVHAESNAPCVSKSSSSSLAGHRLISVAYGRSGDKGTGANVGILARTESDYAKLSQWLTAERVHAYFKPLEIESVERIAIPNLLGFNFLLRGVLRRGIRNDAQGKAIAQALLLMPLDDYPSGAATS